MRDKLRSLAFLSLGALFASGLAGMVPGEPPLLAAFSAARSAGMEPPGAALFNDVVARAARYESAKSPDLRAAMSCFGTTPAQCLGKTERARGPTSAAPRANGELTDTAAR